MERIYRILILLSTAAYILWFFQPYNSPEFVGEEAIRILGAEGYGGSDFLLNISPVMGWVLLLGFILAAVGMVFYISAARASFVLLLAISIVLRLFTGLSVQTSINAALLYFINIADGVIVFMSYFSSVADNYSTHNKSLKSGTPQSGAP